jgi:hypothetical protein
MATVLVQSGLRSQVRRVGTRLQKSLGRIMVNLRRVSETRGANMGMRMEGRVLQAQGWQATRNGLMMRISL